MDIKTNKKSKEYYNENNKKFMEKVKGIKYECEVCKGKYSYYAKSEHNKTKKHLKALENINKVSDKEIIIYII